MKVEILDRHNSDGRTFFEWSLWDGPDDIEEVHGYAADLITAFSKIIEWRERIAADYNDLHTNNDTDCEPTN